MVAFSNIENPNDIYNAVINKMKRNEVFHWLILGSAGSGKTTMLRKIHNTLGTSSVFVLSFTNTGANVIGGRTIHSEYKIPVDAMERALSLPTDRAPYLKLVIIDEVPMCSSKLLEVVEQLTRKKKQNQQFFGGVSVLLCGDFKQLPPTEAQTNGYCYDWSEWLRFDKLVLTSNYRQSGDEEYLKRLERWGRGVVEQDDVEFLRPKAIAKTLDIYDEIAKFYHNQKWTAGNSCVVTGSEANVKEINELIVRYESATGQIEQLDKWIVLSQPTEQGLPTLVETHMDSIKIPIAEGSHVAVTERIVSGKTAVRCGAIGKVMEVLRINGVVSSIILKFPEFPTNFTVNRKQSRRPGNANDKYVVFDKVFPLAPPYACTFRQVQGRTLDRILIDTCRGSLYPAAFYCAASRVKKAEGLFISNLLWDNKKKLGMLIQADPQMLIQMENWKLKADTSEPPF